MNHDRNDQIIQLRLDLDSTEGKLQSEESKVRDRDLDLDTIKKKYDELYQES